MIDETKWLRDKIAGLTESKNTLNVAACAASDRVLPKGTPFPGPYRNDRTPYLIEPMNSCSEHNSTETEVWLKAHQLGFTLAVENIIQYVIKYAPGPILYTTASDELGKQWSETRFDKMIEQSGMADMIFSQSAKKGNKKTGDKTLLKEFPGGLIKIAGYGSTASFRSSSYRYFFGDEIDEASTDLKKQGNTLELAEARTSAYKAKRKIVIFSTPIEEDLSNVWAAYILGDQRKYFVPCPYCGHMQELIFEHLVYERDKDGILDVESVKHPCQSKDCDEFFYNYHKAGMYTSGLCQWRATAKSKRHNYVSRQISCLYSPAGMITWADIVQKYIDAIESEDPGKLKSFETLYLGRPYKERGEAPKYTQVIAHRSNYPSKTVPDGVVFLTLATDVQGNRLELEVLGHGRGYRTWSIDYMVIKGDTDDENRGAFAEFREKFLAGEFVYKGENGKFAPQMAFIDSGYRGDIVTKFCETCPGLYPIVGQDKFAVAQKRFELKELPGSSLMLIRLSTNFYKDRVYASLRTDRPMGDKEVPPGYPSFPFDYDDAYFKMLNAEYKRAKRIGKKVTYEYYCPKGRRNEALDTRCYNLCAAEVIYFLTLRNVLKEQIESYEKKLGRHVTVAEKMEFFYNHMSRFAKL